MSRRSAYNRQSGRRRRQAAPIIDADVLRRAVPLLLGALLFAAAYVSWTTLTDPDTLPFYHIKIVTNSEHVSEDALQNVVASNIEGGFFSLNSKKLRQAVLSMPWVEDVALRIIWPDLLEVDVIEQKPLASWNHDELINVAGDIFQPPKATFPDHLPSLDGSDENLEQLLTHFHAFNDALLPIHLSIQSLKVDTRQAWSAVLSNGIQVNMGRKDVDQRFSRFVRLYPRLVGGHTDQVSTVDLRYPNGFAIGWKKAPKTSRTKT